MSSRILIHVIIISKSLAIYTVFEWPVFGINRYRVLIKLIFIIEVVIIELIDKV